MKYLSSSLDAAYNAIVDGDKYSAGKFLGPVLNGVLDSSKENMDGEVIGKIIRKHQIFEACMGDPFTRRAFEKPRGYAGDAVMLDYIYRPNRDALSVTASTVNDVTTSGPMGLSIKYRRDLLRAHIDQVVSTCEKPRILSVASGHCRELDDSLLRESNHQATMIAFDQDSESCALVRSEYASPWLEVMESNVKKLLRPAFDLGHFDLIYSAGLYDYLPDAVASALTEGLWNRLKPGGCLLLANFLPDCFGRGYMEYVMDWRLLWRSSEDVNKLLSGNFYVQPTIAKDPHRNVVYASWIKP